MKAAYLYNFGKFVSTKDAATDRAQLFRVCVLGDDPFGSSLDAALANQTLDGKKAIAKRIVKAQDAMDCQILFISASEKNRLEGILQTIGKTAILTVSDMPRFTQRGGMIGFVMRDDKVRFEANVANADHGGLELSSDLLKVALTVRRESYFGD